MKHLMLSGILSATVFVSPLQAKMVDRPAWMNAIFFSVEGWQVQCAIKTSADAAQSKCDAIYVLDDGAVSLNYGGGSVSATVIGPCMGGQSGARTPTPLLDVAKLIEGAAPNQPAGCIPPVLTAKMFAGVDELNKILTLLTERR